MLPTGREGRIASARAGYDSFRIRGGWNMTDAYQLLIGGEHTDATSGKTFDTIDPSTGERFATVAAGGAEDAGRALEAARTAFDDGAWPRMKGRERAQYLMKAADLVKQNAGDL